MLALLLALSPAVPAFQVSWEDWGEAPQRWRELRTFRSGNKAYIHQFEFNPSRWRVISNGESSAWFDASLDFQITEDQRHWYVRGSDSQGPFFLVNGTKRIPGRGVDRVISFDPDVFLYTAPGRELRSNEETIVAHETLKVHRIHPEVIYEISEGDRAILSNGKWRVSSQQFWTVIPLRDGSIFAYDNQRAYINGRLTFDGSSSLRTISFGVTAGGNWYAIPTGYAPDFVVMNGKRWIFREEDPLFMPLLGERTPLIVRIRQISLDEHESTLFRPGSKGFYRIGGDDFVAKSTGDYVENPEGRGYALTALDSSSNLVVIHNDRIIHKEPSGHLRSSTTLALSPDGQDLTFAAFEEGKLWVKTTKSRWGPFASFGEAQRRGPFRYNSTGSAVAFLAETDLDQGLTLFINGQRTFVDFDHILDGGEIIWRDNRTLQIIGVESGRLKRATVTLR
jgi:hypothetical protein